MRPSRRSTRCATSRASRRSSRRCGFPESRTCSRRCRPSRPLYFECQALPGPVPPASATVDDASRRAITNHAESWTNHRRSLGERLRLRRFLPRSRARRPAAGRDRGPAAGEEPGRACATSFGIPGRLIGKQELMDAIWPDAAVTDDSLVQCLVEIRRALGDDQAWVHTARGRGLPLRRRRPADRGQRRSACRPRRPTPAPCQRRCR